MIVTFWALIWRQTKRSLDGPGWHLMYRDGLPLLFRTRQEARSYALINFGYIAKRPDLQDYPHGWTVPQPVRVELRRKWRRGR